MKKRKQTVSFIIKVGVLSALAAVVQLIEFPLGIFPSFYQFDFSDIIALIGSFSLGPAAGMLIELFKNMLHLLLKPGFPFLVGEFANFLIGFFLVFVAGAVYQLNRTRKGALIGMICGAASFILAGALLNYFFLIPTYFSLMGSEEVISTAQEANAGIVDLKTLIFLGTVPFNLIKSIVISLITFLIYKRVSPLLRRE